MMSRRLMKVLLVVAALAAAAAVGPASSSASFGVEGFEFGFFNEDGSIATQAGSHPYALRTQIQFNTKPAEEGGELPDGMVRDIYVNLPTGFVGTDVNIPQCSTEQFVELKQEKTGEAGQPNCPNSTAIGISTTHILAGEIIGPVFNLVPPPGVVVKIGYWVYTTPVILEVGVKDSAPYNVVTALGKLPQTSPVYSGFLELWGVPASSVHDSQRGHCYSQKTGTCTSSAPEVPLFTLPTACTGPLAVGYAADSWEHPGSFLADGSPNLADPNWSSGQALTHDTSTPPNPQGLTGCSKLGFTPRITAQPTTKAAQSPTGLDFSLNVADEGISSPTGLSQSDIRKAVVTLPEGFTTNPSLAEGLTTCSEADLARETVNSEPGEGCPNESKIGTVEVESPLLGEPVDGSLFIATPYENQAGNSLIGLYMVIRNTKLGIIIKQPLKVENDPVTGQITTVAEEIPQLPFSHFKLHFRQGTRSPLASPSLCGSYDVPAVLTPWSGTAPITSHDTFQIIAGPNGGPCPSGGTPPFHPGLEAGTINNAAGSYSPFYLHLTRNDGEQEITHFSIKLPPGVVGKLAGIPFCSDAAISAAAARTGPHGGQEEIEHPSCPAVSEIGHTLVGAGVGPSLAYAPGKVYLAGPYKGAPLSIAAITAAKVGPFDLGTVVVREALKVNPETAEVFVDATGSDPLPHIIKGIPVHLRDIRVYVDKPEFVINPTSCERTSTASTVLGSGTNFASESDDQPVTVTSPFQAASCASLGFAPKLSIALKGGTKRSANPALKAVVTPRKGDANIGKAVVALPPSEFLEQGHIKTVCTRVQFNAGGGNGEQCPAASVYGRATAVTPLLSEPLTGPVFLRSSSHKLPDLVAALHGSEINIDLDGRIDSAKGGGIRTNFEAVPDAPVTKFTLEMFGGKKSLLVNSTNICKGTHKAIAEFKGQNGKTYETTPAVTAKCGKKGKKGKGKKSGKDGAKKSKGGDKKKNSDAARLLPRLGW
jgi:hypothetical protein